MPLNPFYRLVFVVVSSPARDMVGLKILFQGSDLQTSVCFKVRDLIRLSPRVPFKLKIVL